ncbi:unnamed protein product [Penicillium pancosmium]
MAIFDSEKRPRGLRVPSLTAMKAGTAASVSQFSFHRTKSNEAQTPEEKPAPPLPVPSSTGFPAPVPAPPPTKQLPTPPQGNSGPKKELPPRPRITSKVPPRRAVGSTKGRPSETSPTSATSQGQGQGQGIRQASSPITPSSPPNKEQPLPPTPSLGLRQAAPTTTPAPTSPQLEQEAASPATIKASNQGLRHADPSPSTLTPTSPQLSKPQPAAPVQVQQVQQPLPPTPPVGPQSTGSPEPTAPATVPAPAASRSLPTQQSNQQPIQQNLPPTPPPVTLSPPPANADADEESDALTPLEDFIPTPDGASTPLDLEQMSSNEAAPPASGPAHPPALHDLVDIPAPPLNKVHYACFQEHRNMPIAQNVWCPVPCMTCHKKDQEIRHRCVFCSLRKVKGKDLGVFLKTVEVEK